MTHLPIRSGLHDIPEAEYHADPCPKPSLSSSIAVELLDKSPRHAWQAHPRLGGVGAGERQIFDLGAAAHGLLLGNERVRHRVIDAGDYKTKAAREERDAAYAAGEVPLLVDQYEACVTLAAAVRGRIKDHPDLAPLFAAGSCERTLVWQEDNGIWCRALVDWLPAQQGEVLVDIKTTGMSASPAVWGRTRMWRGPAIQSAHYCRGAAKVLGWERPRMVFVVAENAPPYEICAIELGPRGKEYADRRWTEARDAWGRCLATGRWPGYPGRICYVDPPAFVESEQTEREARQQFLADEGTDDLAALLHWQAPPRWKAEDGS